MSSRDRRNVLIIAGLTLLAWAMFYKPSASVSRGASRVAAEARETAEPKCSAADFRVEGVRARREYDNIILVGKVTNTGSLRCGVQVKASSYDKAGAVLDTADFWPASIRNISPGTTENFKYFLRWDSQASTFDIEPIDARQW